MNENEVNSVNAIRFCIDKEVEDYGYQYTVEDIEPSSGKIYAYINFSEPSDLELHVRVSDVVKNEDNEYDCKFEVSLGEDNYEVSNWWGWQAKYFWMALLSK